MSLGACIRFLFGLFIVELVLTLAFVNPTRLSQLAALEVERARITIGDADTERVLTTTVKRFWWLYGTVGFAEYEQSVKKEMRDKPKELVAAPKRSMEAFTARLKALTFLALFRLEWMLETMWPAFLFLIAACIDGLVSRRKRAFTFAATSTVSYNTASYVVLLVSMAPLLYLIAPIAVWPLLLPVSGLAVAAAAWVWCAHLPGAAPIIGMRT